MTFRAAALGLMMTAAPLAGQGKPLSVNGRLLPLRSDTFAVFLVSDEDTVQAGVVVDQLSLQGDSLVRIYSEVSPWVGMLYDTIISSPDELRPLAYRSQSSSRSAHLAYDSVRVTGWQVLADGDTQSVSTALPYPVFDGASFDLVVRASALSPSFALNVPTYLSSSNAVSLLSGRVVDTEAVDGHPCWVFKGIFAGMPVTFWIDKDSRALRRQFLVIGVGRGLLYASPPRPTPGTATTSPS